MDIVQYGRGRTNQLARSIYRRAAQRVYRQLQREARLAGPRQVASSSLVQRLGPQDSEPPPMQRRDQVMRRINFIGDTSSYQQFQKYKYRSGRKRSAASKRDSILQTIIANYRLRVSNISDLASGSGAYFLGQGPKSADFDLLPVMLFNLSSIRQGNVSANPIRRLTIAKLLAFDGALQWDVVNSKAVDNTGATVDNSEWQFEDNEGGLTTVGRKSWLDWVRIRLTLWGKQNAPAKFNVRLVKFSNEEYCPEAYPIGTGISTNATQFYQALVKPLITDPSAGQLAFPRGAMKVLKTWNVEFDPISTTEADQDPHCKAIDVFHRFGKTMDYTSGAGFRARNAELNNPSHYFENNDAGATGGRFGVLPRTLEDSVYLMITSLSQDRYDPTPLRDTTASLSWNIQVAHKTVQPDIATV